VQRRHHDYRLHRLDGVGTYRRFHRQQTCEQGKDGLFLDILLGVMGAVVCGWLFNAAGVGGVTSFNAWSLIYAVVGAVFLVLFHSFRQSNRVAAIARH